MRIVASAAIADLVLTSRVPMKKITDYLSKTVDDSIEATVSRMVALDGIPFRTFANSAGKGHYFANLPD
jgi:hypothetical protein